LSIPILRNEVKLGGREWSIVTVGPEGWCFSNCIPKASIPN
jgi:hypothetical protein